VSNIENFMFTNIPGSGKGWILVVTALSLADAKEYIGAVHKSGKYLGIHNPSKTDFESMVCGAVTDKVALLYRKKLEEVMW